VIRPAVKAKLHPRNRFRDGYDFPRLVTQNSALAAFVRPNAHGDLSIDFANPRAVKALNQALLKDAYGLETWDLPDGYLCPPIPGRSDYLHYLADLLAPDLGREASDRTPHVLDIGVGANCIYPLIGAREYGWHFVGSDIDPVAVKWAQELVAANPAIADLIECRLQSSPRECFTGVVRAGERFDATMCNPPFHASALTAAESSRRKRRHLDARTARTGPLNFGGTAGELWCEGGELGFVQRMIAQSAVVGRQCRWFTTLVSQSAHLPRLRQALTLVAPANVRVLDMAHGQKKVRILAWTFVAPSTPHVRTRAT
jgi:23S rRNA (adenine1618-N6)-methyltransferase